MPLFCINEIAPLIHLAIWEIDESLTDLVGKYPLLSADIETLSKQNKSKARVLEKIITKLLLTNLFNTPFENPIVVYDSNNKPSLSNGCNISISHTKRYVAVIISNEKSVAVDIEMKAERVLKISKHFLRNDENVCGLRDTTIAWCAKETLYKLKSERHLQTSEMRVSNIPQAIIGDFYIEDTTSGDIYNIYYVDMKDAILTYSFV